MPLDPSPKNINIVSTIYTIHRQVTQKCKYKLLFLLKDNIYSKMSAEKSTRHISGPKIPSKKYFNYIVQM